MTPVRFEQSWKWLTIQERAILKISALLWKTTLRKTALSKPTKEDCKADQHGPTSCPDTRWPSRVLPCSDLHLTFPLASFSFSLALVGSPHSALQISFIPTEAKRSEKANRTAACGNSPPHNARVTISKHSFYEQIVEQQLFLPPTSYLTAFLIKPLPSTSRLCRVPLGSILNMTFLIDLLAWPSRS